MQAESITTVVICKLFDVQSSKNGVESEIHTRKRRVTGDHTPLSVMHLYKLYACDMVQIHTKKATKLKEQPKHKEQLSITH